MVPYHLPALLMVALAVWLGMSLLLRAPRVRPARTFAWLCLHLTLYGLATALPQLTASPGVAHAMQMLQVIQTVILPPVFLHFIMALVREGTWPRTWRIALVICYLVGGLMAGYALFSPAMIINESGVRYPGGVLVILWAVQRATPLLGALALMLSAYRRAIGDDMDRRRRMLFAFSAVVGVVGALWAAVARDLRFSPDAGHALMDAALLVLAYAVLVYRSLLPARVAQRAFYRSLIGGALTAVYIGLILLLEPLARHSLQIDGPLVPAFALVVLVAAAGPLRDWVSGWLDQRFFHREFDYGQLLRSLGEDLFERGDLTDQLQTALGAICGTLGLRGGVVAVREADGLHVRAVYGDQRPALERLDQIPEEPLAPFDDWEPWPVARLVFPLRHGDETLGVLALAEKHSGEPFRETEQALLGSLGAYVALAIRHARRQQEEELAMAALAEQSRQLRVEQEQLLVRASEAIRDATPPPRMEQPAGLRVFALGPLRVERDGISIDRWGGDKAGTYQAEALFAFLFDRRGRGLTKDEAEEVIWPDLDMEKADMAFHRTVSALRRTLEPGLRRGNESRMVAYHHERYWLDPAVVALCDADIFAAGLERGHTLMRQGDLDGAREQFVQALGLYRGDYMDDCPFFGDSSYVEGRRTELRDQQIDGLLTLGAIYERMARSGEAVTCYRRALTASDGDCVRAEDGLTRLQVNLV